MRNFYDLHLTQDGESTLISVDGNNLATVLNIEVSNLNADNFLIV